MNLINQLFFAVMISSLTGTFLFAAWRVLRGFFMMVNPKMIYVTLKWICVMYLLPLGYMAVILTYQVWFQGQEQIWKLVFVRTKEITSGLRIFSVVWFVLASLIVIYRLIDDKVWCRRLEDNIDEEPEVIEVFERVCECLGIREGELGIAKNVLVPMPMIVGVKSKQILLPEGDYTARDLEMIFFHELSHYKHKDLRWKIVVVIITMIHCFNPAAYILLKVVNDWSECMADVSALEHAGHIDAHTYFSKILNLVPDRKKPERERYLFSTLHENDRTLDRRIDFMKKYKQARPSSRVLTAIMTAAFACISTSTAFASGKTVADLHNVVYQSLEEKVEESNQTVVADDGFVEHTCSVEDLNMENMQEVSTLDQDIVTITEGVNYTFNWTVNPNTRHVSGEYVVNAGQVIDVGTFVTPSDKTCWLGIMNDEGTARYISGSNVLTHKFKITKRGRYRVFVQNNYKNGTTLYATGRFSYDDE